MTDSNFAVITLTNTTSLTLDVSVSIGGADYFVVSLSPGQATSQLSPTGASWTLAEAGASAPTDGHGGLEEPDDGGKPILMT